MTRGTSLCPFTPPSAFWRSTRASNAAGDDPFSAAAWPVTSVMYAMVIGAGDAAAVVAAAPNETNGKLAMAAISETRMAWRRHTFPPWYCG